MAFIAIEEHAVSGDGVTLDHILWRRFKARTPGLLEALLALPENWRLEFCDAVLPLGTKVFVPIPAPRSKTVREVVELWS
jgi:phage tail protein X